MGDFSDDFSLIDDAFYGDGTTDATTQPLDCLIENLIDSNARWLTRARHRCPMNFAGEDRIYASVYWMAVAYVPVRTDRGIDAFSADVAGVVESSERTDPETSDIEVRLRLLGRDVTSDVATWTGDGTLDQYSVSMALDEPLSPGWDLLMLEVRSNDDGIRKKDPDFSYSAGGSYGIRGGGTDSLEEGDALILPSVVDNVVVPIAEVDFTLDNFDGSGTTEISYPTLNARPDRAADAPTSSEIEIRAMTYLRPRSVWWSADVADDREHGTYLPKPAAEMYANQAVLGRHVTKHQQNTAHVYTSPTAKSSGPLMKEPTQTTWGSKWLRWPTAYADEGDDQSFGDLSLMIDRDTSVISVNAWLCFAHILEGSSSSLARELDLAVQYATRMDWEIDAEILQASGSDWSSATSIATATTETLEAEPHMLCHYVSSTPLLQQIWYSWYHQGTGGQDHYMWYEGGLIGALGDTSILHPVTLQIDVSKADADDFDLPVRLKVTASPDTSSIEYEVGTLEQNTSKITARMVALSAHESGVLS